MVDEYWSQLVLMNKDVSERQSIPYEVMLVENELIGHPKHLSNCLKKLSKCEHQETVSDVSNI